MDRLNLQSFHNAFPRDEDMWAPIEAEALADSAAGALGVKPPNEIVDFWSAVGSGYFGRRTLYVFGDGRQLLPRASLLEWNSESFWRDIFPRPSDGGPFFFAETCFGEQLGLRWSEGCFVPVLFLPDTFESFVVAPTLDKLFSEVLVTVGALSGPERLHRVTSVLGLVPAGKHFVPIVSPLVGGTDAIENFHTETPNVHLRTALATHRALSEPV